MKKTKFLMAALLVAMTALTTSCFNEDDDESSDAYTLYGYCTIVGTNPSYKFYFDGGGIVTPTQETVNEATSSKGFGTSKRAYLVLSYKDSNRTTDSDGEVNITSAEIQQGTIIPINTIKSQAQAEADSITANDSIWQVSSFDNVWAYRGYVTVLVTGLYATESSSIIYPDINLVYKPEDVSENAIKFHVYYNVRPSAASSITGYTYNFPTSYPIQSLASLVPGTGDITMTFEVDGDDEEKSITVTRSNLTPPSAN